MIQYLVVLLDDTSASYCHYSNNKVARNLIPLNVLQQGIRFAMLENLTLQFVYPDYTLPDAYNEAIESIDHCKVVPSSSADERLRSEAEVIILDGWTSAQHYNFIEGQSYILRTSKTDFFHQHLALKDILPKVSRLNVVFTDVETFSNTDFNTYKEILSSLSAMIETMFAEGHPTQLNLLTDRMILSEMNNCNAGDNNITLAPDGNFYICPAFYHLPPVDGNEQSMDDVCQKSFTIGNIQDGVDVKNAQLYKLIYAPICRHCDAYQCKRCVWLNRKTTNEVNTPSHEQCVVAHLERNASRNLLANIRKHGSFLPDQEDIAEIDYLDPFYKLNS